MQIIPAIDFKDGKVVNLKQGRLDQSTTYSDDPIGMAAHWVSQGAERLHLVDLDGAFQGYPVNQAAISIIAANHPELVIQLGGGIRSAKVIEAYLKAGVNYVIIGTQAVDEPEFVGAMCREFPGHIMVGLDGLHGMVAKNGWKDVTDIAVKSLAMLFESDGIEAIVYTDIGKDGMMGGVNINATR
ncbi:MAG: phosphoribosylformimino-5-aminoimidazole carboxamide ribotide isomerase, partial [Crocinitomicaceae bacterium]